MTGLIQDRFRATAARQPGARAIVDGDLVVTYEQLDQQSNALGGP